MGKCHYCDNSSSVEVLDDDEMIMVCDDHDPNKQMGSNNTDNKELRCTNCNATLLNSEVVNNGEYDMPVSKCCTAYIKEYNIFILGTKKV